MEASRQNPVLEAITETYDWAYLAHTTDTAGNNIGRSDGKATRYYGDRDYFQQVMQGQPVGQQVLIGKTSGEPALVLAKPIYGASNNLKGALSPRYGAH